MFVMLAQTNPEVIAMLGKSHQFIQREMEKISTLEVLEVQVPLMDQMIELIYVLNLTASL